MPIDFTKAAAKLATKPRDIDYIAYILDEHKAELNSWELGFCQSCLKGLREKYAYLTGKQCVCLDKIIVKFKLRTDEFCVRGYADRTDSEVISGGGTGTTSTKMAQAGDDSLEDLKGEDDLPSF